MITIKNYLLAIKAFFSTLLQYKNGSVDALNEPQAFVYLPKNRNIERASPVFPSL